MGTVEGRVKMATKLDAVKNLADRYRGVTRDQDRDTEKDIEKRQAAASLAQSYREKAAAKKMAEEKEERDRLSFNARLADRIRTPARYENVARLTPIEEQTDEEIEAKIGSLRKELEKTRSGSLVSRTKESLGALLGFGKDGEEKKQAWEETQDALYTYEAEKQRRTDEKLLAIAETMSDEEIEARLDELDATTPGVIWDAMAKLGLATGKGERAEKKNESSLLSNYLYERKRERALDSYTLPYSSDADAEQYIKAGMEIEAPKGGLPDWDDRRLYAALTGEIVTAFGLTGAGTGGSAEDKALQYLTDEERNIVAYYVGKGQKDRALGYLEAITDDLMDRQAEDAYETAESFAADHPVIGSAARIASGVGRVGGVIGTAGQWFKNEITGEHEPLDASSPWFAANRTSQALESGVLSNIDSELGRFLAQTGFSIADNVTNRLLFGNTFALTAMGMQAAGDGAYAAAEAGASPEEALVLGIAAGGIEYLTEKIPFDHLTDMLKSAGSSGIKQTLKEVAKQMGSEALEEATSEYANLIVDAVVRGDESEYNQYIAQLVANGMDFSDAEREAVLQYYVENPLLAAAGGALSGGVMGGGASVISHAAESSLGRVDIDDRDRVSLTLQSLGETAKRAGALYDSVYQVVSGKGNEADREAVASSDAARTFVAEQQRARSRRAERAKKSAERAERKLSRSTSRTEGTRLAEGTSSEADARSDSAYGEHGARLRETYGERLTEPAYAEAFSRFYEAGRAGISFEKADAIDPASTVPKQERYRMFAAGQNDVPVSDTGLRGDTFDGWSAEEITTVNKLAHALGVQVVGVESVRAAGADGTYRAARARLVGNTIEVARNATSRETVMQVLGHEFTHRLKQLSADDYARLEAFALSHSQTADEVRARYASLNLSEQDMAEEITAAYAEMLFSDEQTVQRMANEDRGLARRILDFIKDIIGRIRGKVPSELTQAERLWRNALHSAEGRVQRLSRNAGKESGAATKNTAGKDGGKFSIAYTTENEPVVVIEEDILAGVSKSNYAKVVRQAMRKFDRGIPVGGRLIKVNAITRNEFTRSRNTQFYKGDNEVIYRDKMKAGGYLDEIVLASTNYINEGLNHARKDSFKEFARGNVYMKIGENSYSAKVIIGFTGNEMVLYDIVDIQPANFNTKKDSTKANSQKGDTFEQVESLLETSVSTGASVNTVSQSVRNDRQNAPSNDTISQNEDNVNSHDMQNGVKYSLVGTTKEGIEVYETSENVKALSYSERKKLFRQQMEEEYRGRTAKFERNGHVYYAAFEKADIQKNIYGDRRSDRSGWRAKIDVGADGDIFELVENAVYNGSKKEIGKAIPSHQNIDYWDYFIKTVKIDGTLFDVVANVRKGNGDAYVYSIQINEHKKTKASPLIEETSSSLNRVPNASVNTISQSEDNVNTHDMQISEKYSLNAMDKTEALLEQYGALPEGEREGSAAGREVKVPRRTAKENRTRRTVRTVMEAAVTSDEIAGDLKEKIEAGEFSYLPTSNKTLLDNAETLVKEKGFEAVLSEWRAHVESTREANDRMLGVGEYLLIHALKTKDANLAGTLAVELSVEATAAGRSVSAVRMIKRLGPAAKVYEVMRTVEKLSETTIERRGSRKAVEELSEKRDALMTAYLGHEDAMLDARHEVETLEFLRDNLKASEKSEEKIKKLEAEIRQLRGLLEKSESPGKRRELGERLETANGDLEKTRELAKKQRQSREGAIDDLAAIQERIRKAERSTKQDARRIEKIIEKLRRGGAQAKAAGTAAQEMTAEVSAALAEARERLRAVTAEAGNMHAKYSRILAVDRELHKLGKYTVDSALLDAFLNAKTVKEAEAAGNDILIHVASQVPATFADKWNAWRYLSMLGNVRTHVRNILGNAVFVPAVRMKNLIGAALEAGGQKGGVRTKDILHSVLGWHDAYRAFAKADFKEMQDIIKSGGKYNPASKIEENRTIYTSKMLRGLEKLRKGNSYLLDLEDTMALRLHYSDSLAGYLAANKVNLKTIDDATLDRARAYAMEEAWKATFRDASKTASLLNRLSKTNAFTKIFVEGLIPFKKTPINILKRGVEYSPAGLIRTLTKGLYDVKKSNITAAQFIDGLSSGLTGTALVVLGYFLAAAGIIEPGIGDDEKDKFAELQGKQGYALVIGDMSYTIDWLAPAAIPLFVGTSMHTLFHEMGEDSPEVMDVLYDVVEPVFEMSMLQGIENALSAVKYGGDGYAVGNILFEGMTGYFGQAVPTVLGQVARTVDGTRRTTYTESGAPLASGSRFLQSVMNKTPGLSMLNEPYVDEWGREETTENLAWRIFNNFVSPGYVSTYETSPMEEELKRLHDSTGEDVFPRTAPKYFSADGVRVSMNAKEHTTYQKTMGQTAYHTLTELTGLASYKKAEDALRIKAIDKAYDYAAEMAKKAVLGKDYTPSALVENIEDVTAAGVRVSEYLMFMTAVSEMKSVYGKDGKTVILSKQDQVEEYLRGLSLRAAQKKALWGTLYNSESPWG